MFLQGGPAVPATESVEAENHARPVIQRVSAQRFRPVAVGVRKHLVGDHDGEVVFARKRQQMGYLPGDRPERLAGVLVGLEGAFEPIKAGRAVEDDQLQVWSEILGVPDGLFLLFEVVGVGDDEPSCDLLQRSLGVRPTDPGLE